MKQVLRVEDSLIVSFKPNVTRFVAAVLDDDESFTFAGWWRAISSTSYQTRQGENHHQRKNNSYQ